jgi:hypothetical protein
MDLDTLYRENGKAAITASSNSAIDEFTRLGKDEEVEMNLDMSMRGRSSIAFIATDGTTSILFLGDAVASVLKPLYTSRGSTPVDFTLMKVGAKFGCGARLMIIDRQTQVTHHGSRLNNCWARDAQRKVEEKTIEVIRDGNFDVSTLACIYFFAKYVLALCLFLELTVL